MSDFNAIQSVIAKTVSAGSSASPTKISTKTVSDIGDSFSTLVSSGKTQKATDAVAKTEAREDASVKVMQKFEAMVVSQLFGTMLKAMPGDSFGAGMSGDIYKSMFADALGEQIAKHGGLGIAGLGQHTNASRLAK